MNKAGFLYGLDVHYLDHLTPLCDLLNIPIIVTEPEIEKTIKTYYPTVISYCYPSDEVAIKVLKEFDVVFSCLPSTMMDQIFFIEQHIMRKKILSIWVAHGNSDKGKGSIFMEALENEKILLAYGQNMIDFLKNKGVLDKIYQAITIGNFRYRYYQKMKLFYDTIVNKKVLSHFKQKNPIILYAPTWGKNHKSSSMVLALPSILKTVPNHYNLIVKIHPNSLILHRPFYESLINEYKRSPNILFLNDFPPIYPLLAKVDILIGDFSSINYDFLTFNKPMFFLNTTETSPDENAELTIHQCGTSISLQDFEQIFSIIKKQIPTDAKDYEEKRKKLYSYTFADISEYDKIAKIIDDYFEEELHFL
jgi:hypothetical protein